MERRSFLQQMGVLGAAAGLPNVVGAATGKAYDPAAKFDLKVTEVPFRRNAAGRQLMARVYQPVSSNASAGPFPTLLDLHGGAWIRKDRFAEEPMDRAVAASGLLVVAIDMTLSGEAPYPASVQDASYGVRSLISDPYARWQQAEKMKRENLIKASKTYFQPWESIHEGNPQEILERREPVVLRPLLIMQGELDDNVLPAVQKKFAETYRAAGGDVQYELFAKSVHEWVAEPGPQTDRAHETVKAFIARNLSN